MSRTPTPHHDNCTLITDRTGTQPLVSEYKLCATWDYLKIFVSLGLGQDDVNSDHIIWLLTLHNLPSLAASAATKNNYVILAVHDHRCVIISVLAEKKDVFELR